MPDAAGGEGGHGAAKSDGVIHRYPNLPLANIGPFNPSRYWVDTVFVGSGFPDSECQYNRMAYDMDAFVNDKLIRLYIHPARVIVLEQ
jgi:hypothetical protein